MEDSDETGNSITSSLLRSQDYTMSSGSEVLNMDDSGERPASKFSPVTYVYIASLVAAIGGLLFGYDTGIISGALLQLSEEFDLSCFQQAFVVSSLLIGAIVASLVGGFLVDKFGRRICIIVNAAIFVAAACILMAAQTYSTLIAGRLVVGFAVSFSATAECIYISELAPARKRGRLVSLNELFITLGFLMAYVVSFAFITVKSGWRYMFGLATIPAIIQGILMFFLPPSPRFLVLKGQEDKARTTLYKIRDPAVVDAEIESITNSINEERSSSVLDLFRPSDNMPLRLVIGVGLVFFQQFTGQPSVLYYAPVIFKSVGFKKDSAAALATVGLGVIKTISTAVALLFIDRLGRRKFLLAGSITMTFSILMLGISMATVHAGNHQLCAVEETIPTLDTNNSLVASKGIMKRSTNMKLHMEVNRLDSHRRVRNAAVHPATGDDESRITIPERDNATDEEVDASHLSNTTKYIALLSLMGYVSGYAFSFGPVVWLILSEIYPTRLKGRAVSLTTVVNWASNLLVSLTLLNTLDAFGTAGTFLMYAFICLLSVIFIALVVPETKGQTLEQISTIFKHRNLCTFSSACPCSTHSTEGPALIANDMLNDTSYDSHSTTPAHSDPNVLANC